jgi:glycosyltransferase involved in cell wall biosynthesis
MRSEIAMAPRAAKTDPAPRVLVLFGSAVIFGAERGNLEALMALKAQGAEILCLIRDEAWSHIVPPALDERGIAWRKVPYTHIGRGLSWRTILWYNPRRLIAANCAFLRAVSTFKPTHIHAYGQLYIFNFFLGLMLVKTPLVYRAGDEPTYHNKFWRAIWRFTMWRTSRFVANSAFVARSLRNHGVRGDRIDVIYNIPPARPNLAPRSLDLELPPGARVIAFVGQISEHKGPHVLIAAFRELAPDFPDIYLVLAGRISEWEGDAWGRALRDHTIQDAIIGKRVKFLNQIEDVSALLALSEFLVVPSLFDDPSPNVVMEAKEAGRAVVGFPRGGIPELINDGEDGSLCQGVGKAELVVVLRKYCDDPTLAERHGSVSLKTRGLFGQADFANYWSAVYCLAKSTH